MVLVELISALFINSFILILTSVLKLSFVKNLKKKLQKKCVDFTSDNFETDFSFKIKYLNFKKVQKILCVLDFLEHN